MSLGVASRRLVNYKYNNYELTVVSGNLPNTTGMTFYNVYFRDGDKGTRNRIGAAASYAEAINMYLKELINHERRKKTYPYY